MGHLARRWQACLGLAFTQCVYGRVHAPTCFVDTILDALREHKDTENVAQVACSALRGLLEGCPFNQARVDDGGADLASAVAALQATMLLAVAVAVQQRRWPNSGPT